MAIFIIQSDGTNREVDFMELNQLKKDILWIYDENYHDLNCAFAPSYSFRMKYWEYLTLKGDKSFYENDKNFYIIGSMIILLALCVEYNCIASGDQKVFNKEDLPQIIKYVSNYVPKDDAEIGLKEKLILGLKIANSITEEQLINSEFEHELDEVFYEGLKEIGIDFIGYYYENKIKDKN